MRMKITAVPFSDLKIGMQAIHTNQKTGEVELGHIESLWPREHEFGEDIIAIEWDCGGYHRLFWREGMGSLETFLRELNGMDEPDLRNFLVRLHEEMPRQGAEKAGRIAFLEVEG